MAQLMGGNPLVCATALAAVSELRKEELLQHVNAMGQFLQQRFKAELHDCSHVKDIRGKGLMLGIELNKPCAALVEQAWEQGLIINVTAANTIRLLPPLIINQEQVEQLAKTLSELIRGF